ncbi:MAG: response regulator transcription factor [Chloroflexi bacterium]|nr:response regulator transcription factor [Chloroflexota bacterium]
MMNQKSILIISNESELTKILEENLAMYGYRVTSTDDSGEQLRKLIELVLPDLVVIGMAVSCIEAIELTLRIRTWCQVPIIVVKNWGTTTELFDDSACSLMKPHNMPDLLLKIDTAFSKN